MTESPVSVKKWMGVKETAEYLGVEPSTIYHYTHNRKIPFYRLGGKLRFKVKDLDEFIEKHRVPTADEYQKSLKGEN